MTYTNNEVMKFSQPMLHELYAYAIGTLSLEFLNSLCPEALLLAAENQALILIADIKAILDNLALSDSDCFRRIDAVADAFQKTGLSTARHDW